MKLKMMVGVPFRIDPIFNPAYTPVEIYALPNKLLDVFKENPGIRSISIELDNGLTCTYAISEE